MVRMDKESVKGKGMANLEELELAYRAAFEAGQTACINGDDETLLRVVPEMLQIRLQIRARKEQARRERLAEVMANAPRFNDGTPLEGLLQHAVNGIKKSLGGPLDE